MGGGLDLVITEFRGSVSLVGWQVTHQLARCLLYQSGGIPPVIDAGHSSGAGVQIGDDWPQD